MAGEELPSCWEAVSFGSLRDERRPHYLVLALFAGGGVYLVNEATTSDLGYWTWAAG